VPDTRAVGRVAVAEHAQGRKVRLGQFSNHGVGAAVRRVDFDMAVVGIGAIALASMTLKLAPSLPGISTMA
jgi:hypothetical protein